MPLIRADRRHGFATVLDRDPRVEIHEDVLYVPFGVAGVEPGIYDRGRRLVTAAGYFRGVPSMHLVNGSHFSNIDPDSVSERIDEDALVFAGQLNTHYGHYLLSSLPRFWSIPFARDPGAKMLILNAEPVEDLFKYGFIRETMAQLGLGHGDFVSFPSPVRLRRLVVPAPSFEENSLAHRTYARLCNRIGWSLTNNLPHSPNDAPAYLSKSRLAKGISTIVNEDEFCGALAERGVDIVHPETLSLAEQVKLFQERPIVAGVIGSALHTGIFAPRNRLLVLNHGEEVWSNQLLLDGVNGNDALYLHPRGEITNSGPNENFGNNFRLENPRRLASQFLRALDAFMDARALRPRLWDPPDEHETDAPHGEIPQLRPPLGVNLSRNRPARQSSIDPIFSQPTLHCDAAGGVSGMLTGYFQFHTDLEDAPWWEVDLEATCAISEVRVYNRLGDTARRSARIRLLISDDGADWSEACRRVDAAPFGGLDGDPWIWRPARSTTARFVRIQLLARENLHLDQVEVFGERASG